MYKRQGLISRSLERDRRPTQYELDRLVNYFENFSRTDIPVARIIKFAVATGMRQSEICRIQWEDVDARTRCVIVRDRKDPRKKQGNDQRVPLLNLTGYDAWALLDTVSFIFFDKGSRFAAVCKYRLCSSLDTISAHCFRDCGITCST